ncbi:MAG: DUF6798 domain-containing protein [Candidatus Zixiibacteriota bacterium]
MALPSSRTGAFAVVAGSLLFALAYSQSPLFSSNQNTYFLHGLAGAGVGHLSDDLIARSPDPFPVFSWLVEVSHRHWSDWLFHFYYLVILGTYAATLLSIIDWLRPIRTDEERLYVFFAAFVVVHALPFQHPLWWMQAGMAGQYVLGPVFQPSVFGVLLVVSIERFLRHRPYAAVLTAAASAAIHPSYTVCAALLIAAYATHIAMREKKPARAVSITGIGGALLAAVVLVTWATFAPTSVETTRQAQAILVHNRLPHHAVIGEWFGATEVLQLLLLGTAMYRVRSTPLFTTLAVPAVGALLLTFLQLVTGSDALALIFPWRVSVILVPISSAVVLDAAIRHLLARRGPLPMPWRRKMKAAAVAIIAVLAIVGVVSFLIRGARYQNDRQGLIAFVRDSLAPGQLYLVPTRWEGFRLQTGAPLFVDYKTHPYRDVDVIEWYGRLRLAEAFYSAPDSTVLRQLRAAGVTHVILPDESADTPTGFGPAVYRGNGFGVYRLRDSPLTH